MSAAQQAGHMTCTRPRAERQIPLATRASSTHDPMTGEDTQAAFRTILSAPAAIIEQAKAAVRN